MRGPDGSGRDGFIVRPTAEGRLAFGQGMVLSSGWAGEKRFSTWFSGDQPVAQWQKAQARKQFEVFSKLYDDGKRHREHMHQRTQPVLPIWGRDNYERNVSLEQWNPWSPAHVAANRSSLRRSVPPIKKSSLLDKHVGVAGGLICMETRPNASSKGAQCRTTRAPYAVRRDTNYFNLPSLQAPREREGRIANPKLRLDLTEGTASVRGGAGQKLRSAREGVWGEGSGAQTARDPRKDPIVSSVKHRLVATDARLDPAASASGAQTAR